MMRKRVTLRMVAMMMSALMLIALVPVSALPEGAFSFIGGSDADPTSETLSAADAELVYDEDGNVVAVTDALIGDTITDEDWETGETGAFANAAVAGPSLVGAAGSSGGQEEIVDENGVAAQAAVQTGHTPYDTLNTANRDIYKDTDDELDPFEVGGAAYIDRDKLYYGAPATPTIPFTEWAANTSVVNTTGIEGVDNSVLFPDVDLIVRDDENVTYTNNEALTSLDNVQKCPDDRAMTVEGGYVYTRYDYAYEKWGITFDKNVTMVSWVPAEGRTFTYSGQPYLYYSVEQEEEGAVAIALKIKAPDDSERWYTVTSNAYRRDVDASTNQNLDQTPQVQVTAAGATDPIVGEEQYKSGPVTACIDLATWLPTLMRENHNSFANNVFTVTEIRLYSQAGKPTRINYLYMAPSTGNSLVNQVKTADQELGSSPTVNHNGWGNAEYVSIVNTSDTQQIVIDTSSVKNTPIADLKQTATGVVGTYGGQDYMLVTIPVRRWYNVLRDSRNISFAIKSQMFLNGEITYDDCPTMSFWGDSYGTLGTGFDSGDPHRANQEEILSIFGNNYYLIANNNCFKTQGVEYITSVNLDYTGNFNHVDMLRTSGIYTHMIKDPTSDDVISMFGDKAQYAIGYVYLTSIRVVLRKGDVVTLTGSTLTGGLAGINEPNDLDAGSGIQPIVTPGVLNTSEAAANAPQLLTSEYTTAHLVPETATVYGRSYVVTRDAGVPMRDTPKWDTPDAGTLAKNTVFYVLATITYTRNGSDTADGDVWGYTCVDGKYHWALLYGNNGTEVTLFVERKDSTRPLVATLVYANEAAANMTEIAGVENTAQSSLKYSFHGFQSLDTTENVGTGSNFLDIVDTTTTSVWQYEAVAEGNMTRYVNSSQSLSGSFSKFSKGTDWEINPNGGSISVSRSLNIPLNRIRLTSTDNLYNRDNDSGWPVMYYDISTNLNSWDMMSLGLLLQSQDPAHADEKHWVHLYFNTDTNKCTLSTYTPFHEGKVALDCENNRASKPAVHRYTGYISLKELSGYDFKSNDVRYQKYGYSIVGMYLYTADYGMTVHTLDVRIDDMEGDGRDFAEANNTNQDGYHNNELDGSGNTLPGTVDTLPNYKVDQASINAGVGQGALTMYDTINLVDVTVGRTLVNGKWWEGKGWKFASTKDSHGFAKVSNVDDKTAYNQYTYKLNNGILRLDTTYDANVATNNQGIINFQADHSFSTSDYKYLYFSYAMRDPEDGVGYAEAENGNGIMLMLRYGDTSGDMISYYMTSDGNGGMTWKASDTRTDRLWNVVQESETDQQNRVAYHTYNAWAEENKGDFLTAATGCVDLSSLANLYTPGNTVSTVKGLTDLNSIALWCRNASGKDASFHINYLVLSNREPSEEYRAAINNQITQYVYLMDNTGNKYSARFPVVDPEGEKTNLTGEVREQGQRVNPLKVRRGLKIQDGTYYNGLALSGSTTGVGGTTYTDAAWFYQRYNAGDLTNILDVYQYQHSGESGGTVYDMKWSYGRWGSAQNNLYKNASTGKTAGLLLQKYTVENNVLLRQGIEPIYYTTYFNTNGGQMTYLGTTYETGVAVNENNYYTTNTTLFDYFNYPVTGGLAVKPIRTGYTFMGWYPTPQTAIGAAYDGETDDKLYRNTEKIVPGDDTYYAYWAVDNSYNYTYTVTFQKVGSTDTWLSYTASQSNHYLINLPSILQASTESGVVNIVGWKLADTDRQYAPGTKLMISKNVTFVPVTAQSGETMQTVTITLNDGAKLMIVRDDGEYSEDGIVAQHIDVTTVGNITTYNNVPLNVRFAVKPRTSGVKGYWQCNFGTGTSAEAVPLGSATAAMVCTSEIYEFTSYTDLNLTYMTSNTNFGAVVYSCPNVPVANRQMDFYAQVDERSIPDGCTIVAVGTLYTKTGQYEKIKDSLDASMRLNATALASGSIASGTSAVRLVTASARNESGQYRLSVTENNGNALTYYTRAYCVYTDGSSYYAAYSAIVSSAHVDAAVINAGEETA